MMSHSQIRAQKNAHWSKRDLLALQADLAKRLIGWNGNSAPASQEGAMYQIIFACTMEPEVLEILTLIAETTRARAEDEAKRENDLEARHS